MAFIPSNELNELYEINELRKLKVNIKNPVKAIKKAASVTTTIVTGGTSLALPKISSIESSTASTLSKAKTKAPVNSASTPEVSPETSPVSKTFRDNKIFGVDKKIVYIGGSAVGLLLLIIILKK